MELLKSPKKLETKHLYVNLKKIHDLVKEIYDDQMGTDELTIFTHNMATNEITRSISYWLGELNNLQNGSDTTQGN